MGNNPSDQQPDLFPDPEKIRDLANRWGDVAQQLSDFIATLVYDTVPSDWTGGGKDAATDAGAEKIRSVANNCWAMVSALNVCRPMGTGNSGPQPMSPAS